MATLIDILTCDWLILLYLNLQQTDFVLLPKILFSVIQKINKIKINSMLLTIINIHLLQYWK